MKENKNEKVKSKICTFTYKPASMNVITDKNCE